MRGGITLIASMAGLIWCGVTAHAGSVSGTILLPAREAAAKPVDLYGKYSNVEAQPQTAAPRPGVVALVAESPQPFLAPVEPPVMDQVDIEFKPHVLPVQLGTTVKFTNSDPLFHNVFSLSAPKRFDLGRYSKGASEIVVFDKPGVVTLFCEIHAHMQAYIVVLNTPYFAVTDASGAYRIDGVPDGVYAVQLWHESLSALTNLGPVTVAEGSGRFSGGVTGR